MLAVIVLLSADESAENDLSFINLWVYAEVMWVLLTPNLKTIYEKTNQWLSQSTEREERGAFKGLVRKEGME